MERELLSFGSAIGSFYGILVLFATVQTKQLQGIAKLQTSQWSCIFLSLRTESVATFFSFVLTQLPSVRSRIVISVVLVAVVDHFPNISDVVSGHPHSSFPFSPRENERHCRSVVGHVNHHLFHSSVQVEEWRSRFGVALYNPAASTVAALERGVVTGLTWTTKIAT
jgi:hypothetical protein